ncbi:12749_t:CDS:2, partial [Racocetra persica]
KGVKVTHATVCNHLNCLGYKENRAEATPMLTKHIKARIAWAEKHSNDNWENTVFSDETLDCLGIPSSIGTGENVQLEGFQKRQKISARGAFWQEKHVPEIKKVLCDRWSPNLNHLKNLWEIKINVEKSRNEGMG